MVIILDKVKISIFMVRMLQQKLSVSGFLKGCLGKTRISS